VDSRDNNDDVECMIYGGDMSILGVVVGRGRIPVGEQ